MIFCYWARRKNGILISSLFVFHDRDDYRHDRTADDVINTGATLLHSVGYNLYRRFTLFIKVIPPSAVAVSFPCEISKCSAIISRLKNRRVFCKRKKPNHTSYRGQKGAQVNTMIARSVATMAAAASAATRTTNRPSKKSSRYDSNVTK